MARLTKVPRAEDYYFLFTFQKMNNTEARIIELHYESEKAAN